MLPQLRLGTQVELGLQRGMASMLLDVRVMIPAEGLDSKGHRYRSHSLGLTGGGCMQWHMLGGCALLSTGWFNAEGLLFVNPRKARVPYLGMGGRVFMEWALSKSLALRFEGDLVGILAGVRVVANRADVLWTMPPYMLSGAMKMVRTF